MRGRPPKDPAVRQRRNVIATGAELAADPGVKVPPLRKALFAGEQVHPETRRWWRVVWREPMAARWLPSDVLILEVVAVLRNQWFNGTRTIAQADAIARHETRLGLDLMGRKRFDWRIEGARGAAPAAEPAPERRSAAAPTTEDDPRKLLRVVS